MMTLLFRAKTCFLAACAAAPLVVPSAAGVALEGCSGSGRTSGHRVTFATRIALDETEASGFTTALGWSVQLDKALISSGALYFYDGVPPIAARPVPGERWARAPLRDARRTTPLLRTVRKTGEPLADAPLMHAPEWVSRWAAMLLGERVAHAHPGHYQFGSALGQMTEPSSFDLLSGESALGAGEGITGTYRSASFSFASPAVGPQADALGAAVALVEGTAEKDGEETRHFRAMATLADVSASAARGEVDGCVFEEVDIEADGAVHVRVQPKYWFNLVNFSEIEPGTADFPSEFPAGSSVRAVFSQGLAQLSAYTFSYSK